MPVYQQREVTNLPQIVPEWKYIYGKCRPRPFQPRLGQSNTKTISTDIDVSPEKIFFFSKLAENLLNSDIILEDLRLEKINSKMVRDKLPKIIGDNNYNSTRVSSFMD